MENGGRQGIDVYFEAPPTVYQTGVYWSGRVVGKIVDRHVGRSSVSRITIELDPQFEKRIGGNFAFYVDRGRMTAGQLSLGGGQFDAGAIACGFNSKAAYNWFKFKTLLNDRVGKAKRRANSLLVRFG